MTRQRHEGIQATYLTGVVHRPKTIVRTEERTGEKAKRDRMLARKTQGRCVHQDTQAVEGNERAAWGNIRKPRERKKLYNTPRDCSLRKVA